MKNEWISVKEKLPPEEELVLLLDCGEVELGFLANGEFLARRSDTYTRVTHWMPLPEDPRE